MSTFIPTLICIFAFVLVLAAIFLASAIKIVPEHRRLSVYRLGRYIGEKGPGVVILIPFIDNATQTDTQTGTSPAETSQFLVGAIGETKTFVEDSGNVVINGIIWNARSARSIPSGKSVKVKKVIVEVEEV